MSATHQLSLDPRFPVGTVLSVYRGQHVPYDPGGTPVTTATVAADRTAAVTGLSYETRYTAGATISGQWRAVLFTTEADPGSEYATVAELAVVSEAPYNLQQDDPDLGDGSNVRNLLQTRINELETAAGTRRGFEILLPEGEMWVETNTIYAVSNLHLIGRGKGKTVLKQLADTPGARANWSIIRGRGADGTTNGQVDNFTLEGVSLWGNGSASNQIADQSTEAGHNVIFYGATNHRIIDVESAYSRQYGIGYQGIPGASGVLGGLAEDLYFEDVDLHHNGRVDFYSTPPAQYRDGLDVKQVDFATLTGCRAWSNGEKGFDIRARGTTWLACKGWDNVNSTFAAHTAATHADALEGYANFTGCEHEGEGNGWFFNLPTSGTVCRVSLMGCHSHQAGGSGIVITDGTRLFLRVLGGAYRLSDSHGLSAANGLGGLILDGAEFSGNDTHGVSLINQIGGGIVNCDLRSNGQYGVQSTGTSDKLRVALNDFRSNGTAARNLAGAGNVVANNVDA